MAGKDVLATAQTGTGKTLAFLVPAIERLLKTKHIDRRPSVLVLVPTRELAMQVAKVYEEVAPKTLGPVALIMGGASENTQIRQLKAGARLIVATPGRLEDLMDRKLARIDGVEMLVLDEADRMLDMGFIPAIRRIVRALPTRRQTLCFSATLEPSVQSVVDDILRDPVRLSFGHTQRAAESVHLFAYEVDQNQKPALLQQVITGESGQILVFVATKRSTERVATRLERAGFDIAVIHGDRSQSQRNRALEQFKSNKAQVLVATDVAARGIHVDDVAMVLNYDMPNIPEDFIHRAGRTGRAGLSGKAVTFFTPLERRDIAKFERVLHRKFERLALPEGLEREQRTSHVDPSKLKMRKVERKPQTGKGKKRTTTSSAPSTFMLEGEVMQRYAE